MCDWLIAVSPCLGEKERGVKVRWRRLQSQENKVQPHTAVSYC